VTLDHLISTTPVEPWFFLISSFEERRLPSLSFIFHQVVIHQSILLHVFAHNPRYYHQASANDSIIKALVLTLHLVTEIGI